MWPKSIAGFFWGLLISTSLMLNLENLKLFPIDVNLLIGLLLAFVIWAIVMVYCYGQNTARRASLGCLKLFVVSALLNAGLMYF